MDDHSDGRRRDDDHDQGLAHGLALIEQLRIDIAEAPGGSLEAHNRWVTGATFLLTLPAIEAPSAR